MNEYNIAVIPGDGIGNEVCPEGLKVLQAAPDIGGQGIANPIAMIWYGAMILDFLGHPQAADLIMSAIKTITSEGRVLTPDLGGSAKTIEVADEVIAQMQARG